jgi:hypothetical protein
MKPPNCFVRFMVVQIKAFFVFDPVDAMYATAYLFLRLDALGSISIILNNLRQITWPRNYRDSVFISSSVFISPSVDKNI